MQSFYSIMMFLIFIFISLRLLPGSVAAEESRKVGMVKQMECCFLLLCSPNWLIK